MGMKNELNILILSITVLRIMISSMYKCSITDGFELVPGKQFILGMACFQTLNIGLLFSLRTGNNGR